MYKLFGVYKLCSYVLRGGKGAMIEGPPVAGTSHSGPAKSTLLTWSKQSCQVTWLNQTPVKEHGEARSVMVTAWRPEAVQCKLRGGVLSRVYCSLRCRAVSAAQRAKRWMLWRVLSMSVSERNGHWVLNAGLDRSPFIRYHHWGACSVIGWQAELVATVERRLPVYCGPVLMAVCYTATRQGLFWCLWDVPITVTFLFPTVFFHLFL